MTTSERFKRFAPGFQHLVTNYGANTIAVCRKYGYGLDDFNAALQEFFNGRSKLNESSYNRLAERFGGDQVAEDPVEQDPGEEETAAKPANVTGYSESQHRVDLARWSAHSRQTTDTWKRYKPLLELIAEQGENAAVVKLQRGGVFALSLSAYRVFKCERFGRGELLRERARAFITWMEERPLDAVHQPLPAVPDVPNHHTEPDPAPNSALHEQPAEAPIRAPMSSGLGFIEILPLNTGSRRLPHDVRFNRSENRPGFHWSVHAASRVALPAEKNAVRVMYDQAARTVLILTVPGANPERGGHFSLRRYKGKLILNSLAFLEPMKEFPEHFTMKVEESPTGSDVMRILLTPASN